MFIVRPAVSISPRPPDVSIVTSCALPTSAVKFGGWLPPGGLLMFSPSTVARAAGPAAARARPGGEAAGGVDGEDGEARAGVDVVHVRLQTGHRGEQVAVAAHARQVPQRLVVERD